LTDENGIVKTIYTYDPFGAVTITGEASDNPFQYTGRENDGTGLYYYRARYYSPELQRFISEDPIGLAGGINQFAYVGNSPCNWIDPLGLVCGSGWTDKIVPDNYGRYNFTVACQEHDTCYGKSGSSWLVCNAMFLNDMLNECSKLTWDPINQFSCVETAVIYYGAVSSPFGIYAYMNVQKSACKK
jgi:RHS repeat-associated protein